MGKKVKPEQEIIANGEVLAKKIVDFLKNEWGGSDKMTSAIAMANIYALFKVAQGIRKQIETTESDCDCEYCQLLRKGMQ